MKSGRHERWLPKGQRLRKRRSRIIAEQLESRCYLSGDPIVQVNTNFGDFQIELLPSAAPQTVANFLSYVESGAYTDTIFHRSEQPSASNPGDIGIIQTGGYSSTSATFTNVSQFQTIPTNAPIPLEYNLANAAGTVAMARLGGTNTTTATDEFFINDIDNSTTLGQSNGGGYAVFGKIIGSGMDVVNKIAALSTTQADPTNSNSAFNQLPLGPNNELVQVSSITLLDGVYGTVFTDTNANGKQDSGEAGVADRTVFVNVDGSGKPDNSNPSATTDANGNYMIDNVPAGSYQVEEVLPSGIAASTSPQTVTFATSTAAANVNLGETKPSISGTLFVDLNGDAKLDTGDPGLANQTVFLNNDKSGKPDNNPKTTTDANGNFSFTGLAAGSYNVMAVLPANVTASTNTQAIAVTAGQTATANIGEPPSIAGTVFNDLSVSGKFNSGDPGVAGVTVFLNNDGTGSPDGKNPSTTTDANGRFYFMGLASGPYMVEQVVSPNHGVTVTTPAAAVTVGSSTPAQASIGDVLTSPIVPLVVSTGPPAAAATADAAYISALYQYVLGRAPDSAGQAYWLAKLGASSNPDTATLNSIADGFWTSPEHRQLQINQFFPQFLGRQASSTDQNTWVNNFEKNSTVTDQSAVVSFLTTAEYQGLHSGNTALVDALYNDVNLRAADSLGESYWVGQLTKGASGGGMSPAEVAKDFTYGAEATTRLVDALYSVFLHRAPDSSDLTSLVNELTAGTLNADQAAINLLSSKEFFGDVTANQAPRFTSADNTSFTNGTAGTFTVTTSGVPIGAITLATGSNLPSGVKLSDNKDGTATLSYDGTTAKGSYTFQLTVDNGVGTAPKQSFTLTIQ